MSKGRLCPPIWKTSKGVADSTLLLRKAQHSFPKRGRVGQRQFGVFPKSYLILRIRLSLSIELESSSARVKSVKSQQGVSLREF